MTNRINPTNSKIVKNIITLKKENIARLYNWDEYTQSASAEH